MDQQVSYSTKYSVHDENISTYAKCMHDMAFAHYDIAD